MGDALSTIPLTKKRREDWKIEDFRTAEPYEWIWEQKDKFLQQQTRSAMKEIADGLGFKEFNAYWKSYVDSKNPKNAVITNYYTNFPGQPLELKSGKYFCDEFGVGYVNDMGLEVDVISHAIMPVKRVTNIETLEAKLQIAFCRGKKGQWQEITVPRNTLASAQRIIELSNQDIAVNSENAKEVVKFLSVLESNNYDELPRQNAVSHMGWLPDGRFMPYVDDIVYDGGEGPEFDKIYREMKPTGDESIWMDIAKKTRAGESVPARIALAAGFAGPLVKMLDALPFFVHLWGEKGCAKSVGLMLAASIWGNPEIGGLCKTFSGTKVSFELLAAFCGNIPVMLDELQVINDNKKNFDDIIYMLCEGATKGRGAKGGGLQLQRRWLTTIITNGETPIIQSNSGGGAAVRTIEVNYKGTPLFGTDERARDVAGLLKQNYGFAGKKFIEALTRPDVQKALRVLQNKYYNELTGNIDGKQVLSASILLTADALATMAIFKDGKNLTSEELKEFLITKEESDVNLRAYHWLMDFCAANPRRFDAEDQNNGEVWGKYEDGYLCFNRSKFEQLMRDNGYNPAAFLDWAIRKDRLKRLYYGKGNPNNRRCFRATKTVPYEHYMIQMEKDEPTEKEAYQYAVVNDPEEMPF